jgi:vancomycin permeability regulator SanA
VTGVVKFLLVLRKMFVLSLRFILLVLLVTLLSLALPRLLTAIYASSRTYKVSGVPSKRVAIVFGAGLWRDGSPTPVLRDRVATAADLYFSGKVEKLLLSGDNSSIYYNEPAAMHEYALSLGVPERDITLDYAGRRTYDTCYRARVIFGLKDAILVTQAFHLPRAVYTCNMLGLPAIGVPADQREYRRRSLLYWNSREIPATLVALLEVHITHPLPILGKPEPIFPSEVQ